MAGNLVADPELRYTPNGRAVSTIRLAVSERVKDDRTGEWKDGPTAFYNVITWGNLAENVCEVLVKGDRVVAEGRWTERNWTDKDGNEQTLVELTARDLGPSMMFRCARPVRPGRGQSLWRPGTHASGATNRTAQASWLPGSTAAPRSRPALSTSAR